MDPKSPTADESSTAEELPKPASSVKKQKLDPATISPTPLEVPPSTVAAATTSTDPVLLENLEEVVYIPPNFPPENPPKSFLFTWRNHYPNILPDVSFSQGESNSCSYVTAVKACASDIAKVVGIVPSMSSQTLIDNMGTYYPEACIARHERAPPSEVWSSRVRHSMRYLKERGAGINTPYVGYVQIPPPEHPPRGHILTIRGFEVFEVKDCENAAEIESGDIIEVPVGGGDIIPALIREGPIASEMYGYLKSFNAYRGVGVYEGKKPPKLGTGNMRIGHAMLITGYGRTRRGVEYYECQNSYGNTWGDKGYCRVKRSLFWGFCVPIGAEIKVPEVGPKMGPEHE